MATLNFRGKQYDATEEQVAKVNDLLEELKQEIAKIPDPVDRTPRLDFKRSEPYYTLSERYLDRMQEVLESN